MPKPYPSDAVTVAFVRSLTLGAKVAVDQLPGIPVEHRRQPS